MNFNPVGVGLSAMNLIGASFLSSRELSDLQALRLKNLIAHACEHSSFYKSKYQAIDSDACNIGDLPVIKKTDLMSNFEAWVCDPKISLESLEKFISKQSNIGRLYLDRYVIWESSGSSGSPAIFVQDSDAINTYDALQSVRQSRARTLRHIFDPFCLNERIALIGAVDGHYASNVAFERAKATRPFAASGFKSFSILKPIGELIEELNQYAPTIIATYPTTAVVLADALLDGSLTIFPREIWTGGETLTSSMRKHIQNAFGVKVENSYGSSEFFEIAWECDAGHMHVNSDWVILEAVDEKNRSVPHGEMSHSCLITNLANRVQPIIRYDLGDSIRFHKDRCICGSNLPAIDVLGRSDDVMKVAGEGGKLISIMPLAITTAIEENSGIFDFQIEQKSANTLVIRLPRQMGSHKTHMAQCIDAVSKYLLSQGARNIQLIEEFQAEMKLGKSGKFKRMLV